MWRVCHLIAVATEARIGIFETEPENIFRGTRLHDEMHLEWEAAARTRLESGFSLRALPLTSRVGLVSFLTMAFFECRFFSEALRLSTSMSVILPQQTSGTQIGVAADARRDRFPALYLLHGLSDDHTIWSRRTSIERYVAGTGLAVVMPEVHRSFYCDLAYGGNYWTYISEELPKLCANFFPIETAREATFACGFSMGGYGAFKLGLACPDRFAAVASLSGSLDMGRRVNRSMTEAVPQKEVMAALGESMRVEGTDNDLFTLLERAKTADRPMPRFLQHCGTDDYLYDDNQHFRQQMETSGWDYQYEEVPGSHNWDYVDSAIQRVIEWLPWSGDEDS